MEPTSGNSLRLGIALDGACASCIRAFTRGVVVAAPTGEYLATFCQWCLLLALDLTTGMAISEQVLDWERRRNVFGKRSANGRFSADMKHVEGEHSYILTIGNQNIIASRCGGTPRDAKRRFMIPDDVQCRIVQVSDDVQTHPHHDNGDCVPVLAMVGSKGSTELIELMSAVARDGGVVVVI